MRSLFASNSPQLTFRKYSISPGTLHYTSSPCARDSDPTVPIICGGLSPQGHKLARCHRVTEFKVRAM
jgi:hypothetical protein